MPGLMKSALCYKYTYPFGMLNNLISFTGLYDFCSEDKDNVGKCEDVYNCKNLNQAIARILQQHGVVEDSTNSTSQSIDYITSLPTTPNGDIDTIQLSQIYSSGAPDYIKSWMKIKSKGLGYPNSNAEFGCSADIDQLSTTSISITTDITDDTATEILNKINSHIDEHQSSLGFSHPGILASARNDIKNHDGLVTHIKEKTMSIIRQSQSARQSLTYIDNYRKCGPDGKSGTNISQEINLESVSKNIVKTTIQQMMKNDTNIRISSKVRISNTSDRIIFFSLLFNILFIYLTYLIFTNVNGTYMKFIVYFIIIIFVFIMLYISKNNLL